MQHCDLLCRSDCLQFNLQKLKLPIIVTSRCAVTILKCDVNCYNHIFHLQCVCRQPRNRTTHKSSSARSMTSKRWYCSSASELMLHCPANIAIAATSDFIDRYLCIQLSNARPLHVCRCQVGLDLAFPLETLYLLLPLCVLIQQLLMFITGCCFGCFGQQAILITQLQKAAFINYMLEGVRCLKFPSQKRMANSSTCYSFALQTAECVCAPLVLSCMSVPVCRHAWLVTTGT